MTTAVKPVPPSGKTTDLFLTTRALAELLGVTAARVNQLEAERVIASEGRNRWNAGAAVKAYIDHLKHNRTEAADARLRHVRADEIEARNIKNRKALIIEAQQEALAVTDEILGKMIAGLNAVPARVTSDLIARQKIETEIDAVRTDVAKVIAEICATLDAGKPYEHDDA